MWWKRDGCILCFSKLPLWLYLISPYNSIIPLRLNSTNIGRSVHFTLRPVHINPTWWELGDASWSLTNTMANTIFQITLTNTTKTKTTLTDNFTVYGTHLRPWTGKAPYNSQGYGLVTMDIVSWMRVMKLSFPRVHEGLHNWVVESWGSNTMIETWVVNHVLFGKQA